MIRLFLEKLFADRAVWALPLAGFGLTSGIGLMVFAGAMYFYTLEHSALQDVYFLYATVALILLVIPMLALMSSAARLLARRRDERLSGLRLLGASSGQLRRLVLAESVVLAGAGILAGSLLYALLMPLVGLLVFAGQPMGVSGLWLGPGLLATTCAVLLLFAVAAAVAGLRRVEVTPLGVRTRQLPQRVKWVRALIALLAVAVVFILHNMVPIHNEVLLLVVAFAFLAVPLLAVQLVGPWVLKLIARRQAKRAATAERLIAARNVLESPQQMWRQVGGVAIAAFVGVIAGSGVALMSSLEPMTHPEDVMLVGDIQRGVWLTLFVAFLMTACSVGLNQTAQVLDRKDLYRGLATMGLSVRQLNRIRVQSVMRPLATVLTVAVGSACVVALPIVGLTILTAPLTILLLALVLGTGVLLIYLGMLATRPTMRVVTGPA